MRVFRFVPIIVIFFVVCVVYFAVATQFTFVPKWALDYFNPLARSLLKGRFYIDNPVLTYDLMEYKGKWYIPWGILPSLFLIPLQLIKGRYVPLIYLSVLFSSLNVVFVSLLLSRLKKEFFPTMSEVEKYLFLTLFAFGTVHFYVGTLGSSWHVSQIVTSFFGTLGIWAVFRKTRRPIHYIFSACCFGLTLLGRVTNVFLVVLPMFLYCADVLKIQSRNKWYKQLVTGLILFGLPLGLCSIFFFYYNFVRFDNPFESGYHYIHEAQYLQNIRQTNGTLSIKNLPTNLWYMLLEIPALSLRDTIHLDFNLIGNSIFFLTPPLFSIFLALPFLKKKNSVHVDPFTSALWLTAVVTMLPSLLHYSTGWMQFGYRYTLDITVILFLLSVFGMKGKLNILYCMGIVFSIIMYSMGIGALS